MASNTESVKKKQRTSDISGSDIITNIPKHLDRVNIKIHINKSLEDIKERNGIVRGLKRLSDDGILEPVNKWCENKKEEYDENWDRLEFDQTKHNERKQLDVKYTNKICDYLQEKLNVTFCLRDQGVRDEEFGELILYYLISGDEPDYSIQRTIHRMSDPIETRPTDITKYSWYKLCCEYLSQKSIFSKLQKQLNDNKSVIEYLLHNQQELLFNKRSDQLMEKLVGYLQFDKVHRIIKTIRNSRKQTCLFLMDTWKQYNMLYCEHRDELFEVLLIRDVDGKTALHVNTGCVINLIAFIYTPKQRDSFIKLTSITDNENKTALQGLEHGWMEDELLYLCQRIDNNEYITRERDTNILIFYDNHKRKGAENEAATIHDACKQKYRNIVLYENKSEKEIIDLIKAAYKDKDDDVLYTALIVIIAAHGEVGHIYVGPEAIPIEISSIEEAMCSDTLNGKPKMLIAQCCQNDEAPGKGPYAPKHNDFCAVMSCVPGQQSRRVVFLQELSNQIKTSKRNSNIFQLVRSVSKQMEREGHEQTPIIQSTLKAEFCPTDEWDENPHIA